MTRTASSARTPTPRDRCPADLLARFRRDGHWRDESLAGWVDHWAASGPDAVFVSDGDQSLTWGQLRGQSARLGARLRELGVQAGDRVLVQLPNWSEFVVVHAALARIGAVLVPTMPSYRHDEVRYVLDHSRAKVCVIPTTFGGFDHTAMLAALRPQCAALTTVVTVRGRADGALALEDLVAGDDVPGEDVLGVPPSADAPHAVSCTSGAEARPEGCHHTSNTFGSTVYGLGQQVLGCGPDSVVFMTSPVTHATGLAMGVAAPLVPGSTVHLMPTWEPADGLRRIAEHRCSHTMSATPCVRMALDALDGEVDLASLRVWASAGAPIPEVLLTELRDRVPACRLLPVYGNSEGLLVTACRLDDPPGKTVSSDGRPDPGVRLELRDPEGHVVAPGQDGEITFGGPGLMLGYWDDAGRIKDIIIRGGTNISAREVEDHLLAHPAVAAVAVVGVADERLGELACAFVVPKGEAPTLEELTAFLRDERRVAVQKLPERLRVVAQLPMTATGKIQTFVLKAQAAQA